MILVIGGTGNQGGAVADHLLRHGKEIRVLTRNPHGEKAKKLALRGAGICHGDLNDEISVKNAMKNVEGVFSVQNFWEGLPDTFLGYDGEVKQGKTVADLAKASGVKHLVQTSAAGADRNTGIHHFESKREIEDHIRKIGIPHTIIRPVFFMEHFLGRGYPGFRPRYDKGFLRAALPSELPFQVIAVTDIGAFAAEAFRNPGNFMNRTFDLAGDEMTMPEFAAVISEITKKKVAFEKQSVSEVKGRQMQIMAQFFSKGEYKADIDLFRKNDLVATSFRKWAATALKNYTGHRRSY